MKFNLFLIYNKVTYINNINKNIKEKERFFVIKKILLSVGLFVFGLQADQTFLHNATPYPIELRYEYAGWSFVCGCCSGTITAGPNGSGSSGCGILNVRTHYTVSANTGNGMKEVINEGAQDGGVVNITVYMTTGQNGENSFHLTTRPYST